MLGIPKGEAVSPCGLGRCGIPGNSPEYSPQPTATPTSVASTASALRVARLNVRKFVHLRLNILRLENRRRARPLRANERRGSLQLRILHIRIGQCPFAHVPPL